MLLLLLPLVLVLFVLMLLYLLLLLLLLCFALLHPPIVLSVLSSISDNKNAMVEIRAACASHDTAPVALEHGLVSLDRDGDRLLSHGLHQCLLAVARDVFETCGSRNADAILSAGVSLMTAAPTTCRPRHVRGAPSLGSVA